MSIMENVSPLEYMQTVAGFVPESLHGARVATGVSFKNYRRCVVLFVKGLGTAGNDPSLTIEQATDMTFDVAKPLPFTDVYTKEDATTLNNVGQRTHVTQAAADSYTDAGVAERMAVWEIAFKAEDLDIANGFTCLRAQVSDVGTAGAGDLGTVIYLMMDPYFAGLPEDLPSAID